MPQYAPKTVTSLPITIAPNQVLTFRLPPERCLRSMARSLLTCASMSIQHAAVWVDHQEARIFHVTPESFERSDLQVTHHLRHPHKTGGHAELHRSVAEEHPFFDALARHLADAEEILVVGPAKTKLEFVKYVQERHPDLARKIVGVEPSDHPTDGQLAAHVRKYFLAADRMRA